MSVSPISIHGTNPVSGSYLLHPQRTGQITSVAPAPTSSVDVVNLSGAARARSLQLQGYSAEGISAKLGLNVRIVNQYLGITVTKANSNA